MWGDAVYELYIRTKLAALPGKVNDLHRAAVEYVRAGSQAESFTIGSRYYRNQKRMWCGEVEMLRAGFRATLMLPIIATALDLKLC